MHTHHIIDSPSHLTHPVRNLFRLYCWNVSDWHGCRLVIVSIVACHSSPCSLAYMNFYASFRQMISLKMYKNSEHFHKSFFNPIWTGLVFLDIFFTDFSQAQFSQTTLVKISEQSSKIRMVGLLCLVPKALWPYHTPSTIRHNKLHFHVLHHVV